MDKCREEFEKWLDDNNMFMNIERRFDQESNTYDYCAIRWIWESWQHQQAKVEELQTQLSLQRQRVKAFEEELASSRNYGDELQKRVDAATRKWIAVTSIATTCPNQLPDEFFQKLDELHDALCGYELEQALNGDQYDEHRKKAEEAISKGASLTNHRIEL